MRNRRRVGAALGVALALVGLVLPTPARAATVSASGHAFDFGPAGGVVVGATVRVVEDPSLTTTTAADGSWTIDGLTVGMDATFELSAPGRPTVQTATFSVGSTPIERVSFQSPSSEVFAWVEAMVGVDADPTKCQIATTVTRRGHSLYDPTPGTHGEPGATVTIDPLPVPLDGPIYFNLLAYNLIWPDRSLAQTTADGGVLFVNVAPGEYTLRATKPGATIRDVRVSCRAGVITNASPPWGLQVEAGGLDPGTDPMAPSSTTTTTPATTLSQAPASEPAQVAPAFAG